MSPSTRRQHLGLRNRPPPALQIPRRKPYRAARAFYLTLLLAACYLAITLFTRPWVAVPAEPGVSLYKRSDIGALVGQDEDDCRLVHRSSDKCAFIYAHCPTDEAGFFTYLDLYYCRLSNAKPVAFTILIAWLAVLFSTIGIAASDFFCINLSTIASVLGMSESMAGVTLLAFGNGSPDVFSTFAAMGTGSGSLAIGELIGAAGFITAVVAGSMALIRPFQVARKSFIRDVGFFVVAAAFSMTFMYDGRLQLWECVAMVVFYISYVIFVVAWHWWIGRRRQRREREAAARGHFIGVDDELDVEQEHYHDDPDEVPPRPGISRGASHEDFHALEHGVDLPYGEEGNEDEEEEARDRWLSELNSNMRLSRPPARSRRNTLTPIRPSLVGALEFQAVLSSLQKSRNIQTIPMHSRRFSDDPTFTSAQQQQHMSSSPDPAQRPPYDVHQGSGSTSPYTRPIHSHLDVPLSAPGRLRAVSANDADSLRVDHDTRQLSRELSRTRTPKLSDHGDSHHERSKPTSLLDIPAPPEPSSFHVPNFEISQASPRREPPPDSPGSAKPRSPDHLAVPGASRHDYFGNRSLGSPYQLSPQDSPRTVPKARQLPKIEIPRGRPRSQGSTPSTSPFPAYRDDISPVGTGPPSLLLPPPASPEVAPLDDTNPIEETNTKRPLKWWPYRVLPPPGVLISALFPTIYHWGEKTIWEKMLGVVAAPSVLLLTITLPVVETSNDDESSEVKDSSLDSHRTKSSQANGGLKSANISINGEGQSPGTLHNHGSLAVQGTTGKGTSASIAITTEQHHRHNYSAHAAKYNSPLIVLTDSTDQLQDRDSAPQLLQEEPETYEDTIPTSENWNRWLVITQLFLAPLFCVLSIYTQSPSDITPRWLVLPALVSLLVSLIILIPYLLTTTPDRRPPPIYRTILSLAGFVVSIAWISTIASQVVGALKALAVIANISHAIMGLTIFAVGNSLGDLVADITVARLGYPVMALSACFGGPMLNILLGIGLSGSYILITGAQHRYHKHPDKKFKFKPYELEVADTLIVSGITLLITLVGLLIAVPLNKWTFSKRIGWTLIAIWTLSTVGNVVLEVTGGWEAWRKKES
ncbi:hypothetical protein K431DRAFT_260191 [Polychaeton citri CBS 116435]|uniref:Sodium/calcium exchanger membrane region domain-containing protein n=1 Tax=Polychaeton citri CBS 116435 TaxID=1314669 RepID=A0A9P4QIG3_9PEZI|nr:hypothetical protein K431DRAFT_260191 [Polychaeton citri CBS 116435]